jgi:hypothetical protein
MVTVSKNSKLSDSDEQLILEHFICVSHSPFSFSHQY